MRARHTHPTREGNHAILHGPTPILLWSRPSRSHAVCLRARRSLPSSLKDTTSQRSSAPATFVGWSTALTSEGDYARPHIAHRGADPKQAQRHGDNDHEHTDCLPASPSPNRASDSRRLRGCDSQDQPEGRQCQNPHIGQKQAVEGGPEQIEGVVVQRVREEPKTGQEAHNRSACSGQPGSGQKRNREGECH
jgi:hypothetical protein